MSGIDGANFVVILNHDLGPFQLGSPFLEVTIGLHILCSAIMNVAKCD
jgi:hypothetical protein